MSDAKVLVVLGSPRKNGNSATLAAKLAEGATTHGAAVETVYLNDLEIRPCQGCDACQDDSRSGCVIGDDMSQLYPKLREADAIVIASPVYWLNLSAQTKLFIDRLYAVGVGERNIFKGKNMALILSFADPDPFSSGAVNALRSFQDMAGHVGANLVDMIYGSAHAAGEIAENQDVVAKAVSLGKRLAATAG